MEIRMIKQVFLAVLGLFLMATATGQQLPQFSQYIFNSLHINPAYAGYKVDPFVQATYRSQYVGFPGAPRTFSLNADMGTMDESMGFGVSLLSDQIGPTKIQSAMLTYAYRIKTGANSFLGLGISAGTSEYVLDGSVLQPDDPTDTTLPEGRLNTFTPNLNTGLFYHSPRFFTGLSVFNLIGKRRLEKEDIALAMHNYHFYFQMGGLVLLSDEVEFKPSFLIREDLKSPTNYDINAMFLFYDQFSTGLSYRSSLSKKHNQHDSFNQINRKALAAIMDILVTNNLRVGYAYDFNLNKQHNYRNNSHEISVGYYLSDKWINGAGNRNF
jgi:type IX secretion system PorP/SprF family membrane protein